MIDDRSSIVALEPDRSPLHLYDPITPSPHYHKPHRLEAEFATIKKEYLALRQAQMKSDYQTDTEHSLHTGQWE